ncbi:putative anion transporter 6, chloroplastic [Glycine max]|nr:putative anion transporter 6, chloroplastic [Glycine max]
MARLTLRPDNSCFFSHTQRANSHTPFTRTTSFQRFHFHLSSSNHTLRLSRIVSSAQQNAKETQRVSMAKAKAKVLTDLQVEEVEKQHETLSWNWPPWKNLPQRYKLIGTTSLAFIICNMDKVNLSIAIIPMSHQFGWNSSTAGLVQSSFFWGYALSQLPGGWLAKIFGGGAVLEVGVLIWSVATALVPFLAGYMPGLLSIPLEERSRAVAFVFGGLSVGSVMGLLLAPPLIQNLGWESVFYIFGLLGIAWFLGFQVLEGAAQDIMTQSWKTSLRELNGSLKDVPWKAFFQNRAVWAMIYAHFCGSWGHYNCLSWLPTFFSEELNLNLTEAAWVSILPPLASIFVTSLAAQLADNLISRGVETTVVRKICQSIAFLSPAICMTLSSLDLGLPPWEIVGILTSGLALSSFALSGLYCTHQDMSPEYASILLGITNTVGAIPGIVGVALTGYLLDSTHSWSISLFAPSIFFYVTGTIIWLAFASSKPQSFSEQN